MSKNDALWKASSLLVSETKNAVLSTADKMGRPRADKGDRRLRCKKYWDMIPGKSKGYYRNYCDEDDYQKFVIIRTKVEKVIYCRPPGYKQTTVYELEQ